MPSTRCPTWKPNEKRGLGVAEATKMRLPKRRFRATQPAENPNLPARREACDTWLSEGGRYTIERDEQPPNRTRSGMRGRG